MVLIWIRAISCLKFDQSKFNIDTSGFYIDLYIDELEKDGMGSRGLDDHVMRSEAEFLLCCNKFWVGSSTIGSNNTWISQWANPDFWVGFWAGRK